MASKYFHLDCFLKATGQASNSKFTAVYGGTCMYPDCEHPDKRIVPGEAITWQRTEKRSNPVHIDEVSPALHHWSPSPPLKGVKRPDETPKETPKETPDLASIIAEAVASRMPQQTASLDETRVIELIREHSPGATVIELRNLDTNETKDLGVQHKLFPLLVKTLKAGVNVWIVGKAGTGKTQGCHNAASALGMKFYYTGAIDNPYALLGFIDAHGKVVRTQFREAFEHGGLFVYDEVDGSAPGALLPFNAALANGHCAFPDAIIPRHPDFICVATANTWGLGADNDYVGRCKMDAAFLDRFVQIDWTIDEALETSTCGNPAWAKYVQAIRANVTTKGIRVLVSPRASYNGAKLLANGLDVSTVVNLTVRKAMTAEQWNMVSSGVSYVA